MQQDKASTVFTPIKGGYQGAYPASWAGGDGKGWGKGKNNFGHFGKGKGQTGDFGKGGPPGDFGKGKGVGGFNGVGPAVPPNTFAGPSLWRGANRRRRQKEPKAVRDAACAAELAACNDSESLVSASETGDSGKCFAAARHLTRLAEGPMRVCPEAAEKCREQAKVHLQRGQDLLPLSHQVATLEKQYRARVAEAERLSEQLRSLQSRLETVAKEGAEVKRQLDLAKARVAAAPPSAPTSAIAPPDMASALQFFLQSSSLLPPDQAGFFGACLETIQRAVLADPHPVAPGPMDLGASRSVASGSAPVVDPTNVSVPTGPEEVSSNDEFPADWLEREHAAEARLASSAAAPPSGGHPSPAATPARGRAMHSSSRARRGSAPPPQGVRSRSHSLVRTRPARSEVDAFINDGLKYFSHRAERAGLDDV